MYKMKKICWILTVIMYQRKKDQCTRQQKYNYPRRKAERIDNFKEYKQGITELWKNVKQPNKRLFGVPPNGGGMDRKQNI